MTVLIRPPAAVAPRAVADYPVAMGAIRAAAGHFGAFDVTVDAFAQSTPSSRGVLAFGRPRDEAAGRIGVAEGMVRAFPIRMIVAAAKMGDPQGGGEGDRARHIDGRSTIAQRG